jgi:hypothetical protein
MQKYATWRVSIEKVWYVSKVTYFGRGLGSMALLGKGLEAA